MPHAEVTKAIGLLFYRTSLRSRFFADGAPPCTGLSDEDIGILKAIDQTRLERVVELHRADIWRTWYMPRWPATWTALATELETHHDEVVEMLTDSPAFDLRKNDDATGSALSAFITELVSNGRLKGAPWLSELLDYERLLGGQWEDITRPEYRELADGNAGLMLISFEYEVAAIRSSLIDARVFPEQEEPLPCWVMASRDRTGVAEAILDPEMGVVMLAVVNGTAEVGEAADSCRELLTELRGA